MDEREAERFLDPSFRRQEAFNGLRLMAAFLGQEVAEEDGKTCFILLPSEIKTAINAGCETAGDLLLNATRKS